VHVRAYSNTCRSTFLSGGTGDDVVFLVIMVPELNTEPENICQSVQTKIENPPEQIVRSPGDPHLWNWPRVTRNGVFMKLLKEIFTRRGIVVMVPALNVIEELDEVRLLHRLSNCRADDMAE